MLSKTITTSQQTEAKFQPDAYNVSAQQNFKLILQTMKNFMERGMLLSVENSKILRTKCFFGLTHYPTSS
jgi:hypothetical protein